jgi:hypothetical protein
LTFGQSVQYHLIYLKKKSHIFLRFLSIFPKFLSSFALNGNSFQKFETFLFLAGRTRQPTRPANANPCRHRLPLPPTMSPIGRATASSPPPSDKLKKDKSPADCMLPPPEPLASASSAARARQWLLAAVLFTARAPHPSRPPHLPSRVCIYKRVCPTICPPPRRCFFPLVRPSPLAVGSTTHRFSSSTRRFRSTATSWGCSRSRRLPFIGAPMCCCRAAAGALPSVSRYSCAPSPPFLLHSNFLTHSRSCRLAFGASRPSLSTTLAAPP